MTEPSQSNPVSAWGREATRHFYELGPEEILDAVERCGYRCTGRCLALNSKENRVYEIEVEAQERAEESSFVVAKFYRPGRWSKAQIAEEHEFLRDLQQHEIPAIAPLPNGAGATVHELESMGIFYTLFPRQGGRNPDEPDQAQVKRLGHLMARVHNCGAQKTAQHRVRLNPETYGWNSLDYLLEEESIPEDLEESYADLVEELCELSFPLFERVESQRIHGDCHLGNLLLRMDQLYLVDFDDMVQGPCVQDLWLLLPGRDRDSLALRDVLIESYEELRPFDRHSLKLVEPLRALRYIHFSAWIAKRWSDPAFPLAFPYFNTRNYWLEQMEDLRECLSYMQDGDSE
ncbi:MAG: serine/threonine protein kinase [Blastochloris sp.]|nr:serine/threonine protein kinase [Blastochloris sp.]